MKITLDCGMTVDQIKEITQSIIAIIIVAAVVIGLLIVKPSNDVVIALVSTLSVVVGYYFGRTSVQANKSNKDGIE